MTLSCSRSRLLATALASSLLLAPLAQAGDDMTTSQTSTVLAVYSPMLVISIPVVLSAGVVGGSIKASAAVANREPAPAIKPEQVPDMEVKSIRERDDGGREVLLQDPQNPENTAQLQWPARQDDPASSFRVGQNVAFTSSEEGSGWLLRDGSAQGDTLAFVPTAQASLDSHSQLLQPGPDAGNQP